MMASQTVFPGKCLRGAGTLQELPKRMCATGGKNIIPASPSVIRSILPEASIGWRQHNNGSTAWCQGI